MRPWAHALIAGLLAAGPARAADRIDAIVAAEMKRQHLPGVAVAVVKNGRIVVDRGYGLANVEHGVRVTPRTLFQSASVGKIFTAALALLLVEDGKLRLDGPIAAHLAELPPAWGAITLRHLMNHTSGLPEGDPSIDLQKDDPEDALLREIVKLPLQSAPGERFGENVAAHDLPGLRTVASSAPKAAAFAAQPMFLRGRMNQWSTRDRLLPVGRALYEARITLEPGTQQFKIGSHDWSAIDFGARRTVHVFRLDVTDPRTPRLAIRAATAEP